jgi:hypothetical protein
MSPGRSGYGQVQVLTTSRLSTAARRRFVGDSERPVSLTASSMALSISWRGSMASSTFFDWLMKSPTPITTGVEEGMVIFDSVRSCVLWAGWRKWIRVFVSGNRFFGGRRSRTMPKTESEVCVLLGSRLLGEVIAEMVYCLADAYMGCDWLVVASALPSCHHLTIVL